VKKFIILSTVVVLLASLSAIPVLADSKGAVKADIVCEKGGVAGWVIANTNGDGMINLEVHVKVAPKHAGETLAVTVTKLGKIGALTLNKQGNGNAHFQLAIPKGATDPLKGDVCIVFPDGKECCASLEVPLK